MRTSAHATPGPGIEIDTQLVGVVEIFGADGVRVQLDAAEIDDPREAGRVVDNDFFRGAPGRKGQRHGAQPGGPRCGRALLIKRLAFSAVHEALEDDGAVADSRQCAGRDREIVAHKIDLGELRRLRKIQLFRVRDTDFAPVDRKDFGGFGFPGSAHKNRLHDRIDGRGVY